MLITAATLAALNVALSGMRLARCYFRKHRGTSSACEATGSALLTTAALTLILIAHGTHPWGS